MATDYRIATDGEGRSFWSGVFVVSFVVNPAERNRYFRLFSREQKRTADARRWTQTMEEVPRMRGNR